MTQDDIELEAEALILQEPKDELNECSLYVDSVYSRLAVRWYKRGFHAARDQQSAKPCQRCEAFLDKLASGDDVALAQQETIEVREQMGAAYERCEQQLIRTQDILRWSNGGQMWLNEWEDLAAGEAPEKSVLAAAMHAHENQSAVALDQLKSACEALARALKERAQQSAKPAFSLVLRCMVTHNLCGTDTWRVGSPCKCANCQEWLIRQSAKPESGRVCPHVFCSDCARAALADWDPMTEPKESGEPLRPSEEETDVVGQPLRKSDQDLITSVRMGIREFRDALSSGQRWNATDLALRDADAALTELASRSKRREKA